MVHSCKLNIARWKIHQFDDIYQEKWIKREEFPVNVLGCSRNFSSEMIEVMARAARVFFFSTQFRTIDPEGTND